MTIQAFHKEQYERAHQLLASRVATMLGRKFEEADWAHAYCNAKNIPVAGWSNLNIDVMNDGLGVEHKMMCVRKRGSIREYCGTSLMHPAATRSIRVGSLDRKPNDVARDVLNQYAELIALRTKMVKEKNLTKNPIDMRTGWLLWQTDLDEFLYFEEPMIQPDPSLYFAEWNEREARGARKPTKNLWIYDKKTNKKKFSVTTEAGAKIQPYFDVPPPTDPYLYYFKVQGEQVGKGFVRIWVTSSTALCLSALLGKLDAKIIDSELIKLQSPILKPASQLDSSQLQEAFPLVISEVAYSHLKAYFEGVSDEHLMQQFANYLHSKKDEREFR